MEIKWIEDFLALAKYQNFSKAAESRSLTQSGFSRRIQSLEQWMGGELIDRSSYPPTLTASGKLFRERAEEILRQLFETRVMIRNQQRIPGVALQISAGHTISLNFLPDWLHDLASSYGEVPARIVPSNVHDAVLMLVNGGCELMLSYHHPQLPLLLDPARYDFLTIGQDVLMPISLPSAKGAALFRVPEKSGTQIPLLAYNENSFFGRCVQMLLEREQAGVMLRPYCESDMAELLKKMALQGHGLAWLPLSSVTKELERGELVSAGDEHWCLDLDIRLYRDRGTTNEALEKLWRFLEVKVAQ